MFTFNAPQRLAVTLLVLASVLWLPRGASAQGTASLAGTVADATGAVLPGVTVEASSPALLEKTRAVVTDGTGMYKVVSLPPGVYSVTFVLPGFSTVRRDGIELTTGFSATVNAELRAGAVEVSIVVTGETPLVDVHNSSKPVVMTREIVDALPTGKNFFELATLIPGVQLMNGANATTGMGGSTGSEFTTKLVSHGGRAGDMIIETNGVSMNVFNADTARTYMQAQDGTVQEYAFEVSGNSAERESGGVRINLIPKEGSNVFSGRLFFSASPASLQSHNLTDELRAQGVRAADRTKELWNVNPSFGGPIVRDRLWFYGGYAHGMNTQFRNGVFYNTDIAAWRLVYDESKQAFGGDETDEANIRLTWQATAKHKISFAYNKSWLCQCPYRVGSAGGTVINTPEAGSHNVRLSDVIQGNWTAPLTSRLLVETLVAGTLQRNEIGDFITPVAPRITESSTGTSFRAWAGANSGVNENVDTVFVKGSVSYVTGSHAAKIGMMFEHAYNEQELFNFMNMTFATLNYRPTSVTYYSSPYPHVARMRQLGLYAQDQWTMRRLTLNLGVRYDDYLQNYPDINLPATQFVPSARQFPGATLVDWQNLSPRMGATYDVFGNGETALRFSINRYLQRQSMILNPARQNTSMTRPWTDPNGDFIVQGDPLNPAANLELGASNNLNFGQPRVAQNYDPDYANGFGVRPFNWETSVGLQHQLTPRLSTGVTYYLRWYGNFQVTDNLLVAPSDYDPYCVTAPSDARLPGGGGNLICGLFDLNPSKRGQSDNLITTSSKYGSQTEHWNGVDVTIDARFADVRLQGGLSTGKTTSNNCEVLAKLDNPSQRFCDRATPFLTQIKLGGSYTGPWATQVSATLQSFRSNTSGAAAVFTNAQIIPSLGRPLTTGVTATIELIEPDTSYNPRHTQREHGPHRQQQLWHQRQFLGRADADCARADREVRGPD